ASFVVRIGEAVLPRLDESWTKASKKFGYVATFRKASESKGLAAQFRQTRSSSSPSLERIYKMESQNEGR
ncbi:MAG TPA: hypothetical protein VI756_03720, partial [Blastocatellia bacterium]